MRKKWKRNKVIFPLLLSVIMVVEPAASATTVYAEESEPAAIVTEVEQTEDTDAIDTPGVGMEENDRNTDGTESGDSEQNDSQEDENNPEFGEGGGESLSPDNTDDEGEESDSEIDGEEEPAEEEATDEEEIEEGAEEDAADAALNGFAGMPSTYRLTSEQMESKAILSAHTGEISSFREGFDYVKGEVVTAADSQEEAELIAKAYNAEIARFEYGVLTLKLNDDVSVSTAVKVAADIDLNMPAVWPNYYRYLLEEEPVADDGIVGTDDGIEIEIAEYELDELAALEKEEFSGASYMAVYNDPYLKSSSDNYQWHHTVIGSSYAWAEGYTGSGVKVAVLDSGVASNSDLPAVTSIYQSGTSDSVGHGTHVAGIIAAKANNNSGGVGVAPGVTLYSGNLAGSDNVITSAEIAAGINAAVSKNVDLINMSIGGLGYTKDEQDAIDNAYKNGIAIFASAGNDGGQTYSYPACYNHVISVAATDKNNERASFSSYSNMVDLSAPGVAIWSTSNKSNAYVSMSGTSMACPVATGEAAVILGAHDSIKGMPKNGARVDALEKLMKANTVKVGSGMGSGITSLDKVFKLSTASAKPNAPTITAKLSDDKQSVDITITAQAGTKLCYTTNGKNPVWKNETADANTTLVGTNTITVKMDCKTSAKGAVKAFAINASGVTSAVKSCSYTLSPYVTTITVSGSAKVEKGKSIQLAAAVTPSYASNKKVTWDIQTSAGKPVDSSKIKIDQKGKVTTTANVDLGNYKVIVTAQDDKKVSVTYPIQVIETGTVIQSLAFDKSTNKELWITKSGANPTLTLSTGLIAKKNEKGTLVQIPSAQLGDQVTWTSSKPAVATVDTNGKVTALAVGTTTITAKANDNGNKKATINITVKQGVTGITITDDKGNQNTLFSLAAGKSMTLKAVVNPTNAANKKVVWSIDSNSPNVAINPSNGKITVKAGAENKTYTVTATAADGTRVTATQKVKVCSGSIGGIKLSSSKETLYTTKVNNEKTNTKQITAVIEGVKGANDFDPDAYTVTSSNESLVKVSGKRSGNTVTITLTATGGMYGKANVVIASADGSNKKATCAVTVSGGITKAELQGADGEKISKLTLFRGGTVDSAPKTETLTVALTGSDGANMDAYEVTSSNPKLVSVSLDKSSKKVKLTTSEQSTGKATITLAATDGSKKKSTCTVTVVNPVSGITIAPSDGNNGCVAQGKTLQLKARVEAEYGALSNKNVTWELYTKEGTLVDKTLAQSLGMSIASNGKVTAAKNAKLDDNNKPLTYTVKAVAQDGSGVTASYTISVGLASKMVTLCIDPSCDWSKPGASYNWEQVYPLSASTKWGLNNQAYYTFGVLGDVSQGGFTVSSSNPSVISVTYEAEYANAGYLDLVTYKKGSASITIKAMDGSGKQIKYNFVVK